MPRWFHTVALLGIAAILANSQCYALCLASVSQSACIKHSAHCHHESPASDDGSSRCDHRQSGSISAEASPDVAKTLAAPSSFTAVFLPAQSLLSGRLRQGPFTPPERELPPDKPLSRSLAVLRI